MLCSEEDNMCCFDDSEDLIPPICCYEDLEACCFAGENGQGGLCFN